MYVHCVRSTVADEIASGRHEADRTSPCGGLFDKAQPIRPFTTTTTPYSRSHTPQSPPVQGLEPGPAFTVHPAATYGVLCHLILHHTGYSTVLSWSVANGLIWKLCRSTKRRGVWGEKANALYCIVCTVLRAYDTIFSGRSTDPRFVG